MSDGIGREHLTLFLTSWNGDGIIEIKNFFIVDSNFMTVHF